MAGRVPRATPGPSHAGTARLTGEQISAINRFPDDNPNPVLRVDGDGYLIYANPASGGVFAFESRGLVDVKGKGPIPTWLLVPRTEPVALAPSDHAIAGT